MKKGSREDIDSLARAIGLRIDKEKGLWFYEHGPLIFLNNEFMRLLNLSSRCHERNTLIRIIHPDDIDDQIKSMFDQRKWQKGTCHWQPPARWQVAPGIYETIRLFKNCMKRI